MIYDKLATFAEGFNLAQAAGTYLMTNQIDSQMVNPDPADGKPLYVVFDVTEAFTDGGGGANLELRLVSDDTAAIHASTSTLHWRTKTFLKTELLLGTKLWLPMPGGDVFPYERYIGINCVIATAAFTAGKITSFLSHTPPTNIRSFPDAL